MYYVYVLWSKIYRQIYIGSTTDLRRRLIEHNNGDVTSSNRFKPWTLMYYEAYMNERLARIREAKLKHNGNAVHELKKRIGIDKTGAGFTLIELMVTIIIMGFLITGGFAAFTSSQMKSRDGRRKADLRQLAVALETYYSDKGSYPLGDADGNLMGCADDAVEKCTWGVEFSNTATNPATIYMITLPKDPTSTQYYYYISLDSGKSYRLYSRLENSNDRDIMSLSEAVNCGPTASYECNYGIAS